MHPDTASPVGWCCLDGSRWRVGDILGGVFEVCLCGWGAGQAGKMVQWKRIVLLVFPSLLQRKAPMTSWAALFAYFPGVPCVR